MRTKEQYNSKKIDEIILASHLLMHNWDALQPPTKLQRFFSNLGLVLAIGLMAYTAIR